MVERRRLEALNIVEFFAVMIICIMHYARYTVRFGLSNTYPLQGNFLMDEIVTAADILVELLFMISGFLIAYGYFNKIDTITFKEYIKKRVLRLYPLFLVSTILIMGSEIIHSCVTGATFFDVQNYTFYNFILNIFFIQRGWLNGSDAGFNGISWYVSVLFFCYIIWFVLCRVTKRKKHTYLPVTFILAFTALIMITVGSNIGIINTFMMRGIACFFIGVMICWINDYIGQCVKIRILGGMWLSVIIYVIFAITIKLDISTMMDNLQFCGILYLYPLLIMTVVNLPDKMSKIFRNVDKVTRYSYSFYLMHVICLINMHSVDMGLKLSFCYNSILCMLLYLVVCMVVAILSYHIIEKPIKGYFIYCLDKK